ncbi:MAG: DMT family transporter, partial [Cyanobacteria bacterium]|nr:DMT family transporter [Cyanobacteriota bacterium]MDW8202710.1 DMT family transporter [Cyanobacteriota bacterium SKYGB_h_bin112]
LRTLRSLQQDFTSYEGLLPKQLSRMQDIEAQGKAILDALLARLDAETRRRGEADSHSNYSPPQGYTYPPVTNGQTTPHQSLESSPVQPYDRTSLVSPPTIGSARVEPQLPPMGDHLPPRPIAPADSRPSTMIQGIWLMLISTLGLSIHNVVVSIIGFGGKLFGIEALQFGPYINLVIGNSLLILLLRMMVVVPCLAWVAPRLYPNVWRDLERFLKSRDKGSLWLVIGSGACLFVSQVLIYIAIAKIGAGVAVTILFMYPMFTIPLSWWLLGDRPTRLRWAVVISVALGVILTALPRLTLKTGSSLGDILIAVASGIAFAFYLITMGQCFKKQILHPVSLSLVQFTTILFLAAISLWLPLPPEYKLQVTQGKWGGILAGALVLGVLTLIGYLANNLGTKVLGPSRTAIFSSAGPVLTAVLAFVLTPSPQSRLGPVQMLGILVVTLAVAALTQEKKPTPALASTGNKR